MRPSESMVDRVAKAMSGGIVPWDRVAPGQKDLLLQQARWAIEAMGEPTAEMLHLGEVAFDGHGILGRKRTRLIWQAMISAALPPPPKGDTDNG